MVLVVVSPLEFVVTRETTKTTNLAKNHLSSSDRRHWYLNRTEILLLQSRQPAKNQEQGKQPGFPHFIGGSHNDPSYKPMLFLAIYRGL